MTATTLIQVACAPLSAPLKPLQLRPSTRGPSISHYEAATGAPGARGQAAANGRRSASSSGASVRYCEPAALLLEPSFAPAVWPSVWCVYTRTYYSPRKNQLSGCKARLRITRMRVYCALQADYELQGGSIRSHY